MVNIRPFAAIHYARQREMDLSKLIAPPYDGLDAVYEKANVTLEAWLNSGVLIQDPRPALYPYMQSYEHNGKIFHRRGFFALVRLSPFGQGHVIPHEKTYANPIEDRLKLMRATRVQLSPIFGLYSDPRNRVANLLYERLGRPELSATLDEVKNDLWSVPEAEIENQVIDEMGGKPIYIADGHHRYTTALQYQEEMRQKNGGKLPEAHPANWCLFVLIGMQDDGLQILPTHRLIGGLKDYDGQAFKNAVMGNFEVIETPLLG